MKVATIIFLFFLASVLGEYRIKIRGPRPPYPPPHFKPYFKEPSKWIVTRSPHIRLPHSRPSLHHHHHSPSFLHPPPQKKPQQIHFHYHPSRPLGIKGPWKGYTFPEPVKQQPNIQNFFHGSNPLPPVEFEAPDLGNDKGPIYTIPAPNLSPQDNPEFQKHLQSSGGPYSNPTYGKPITADITYSRPEYHVDDEPTVTIQQSHGYEVHEEPEPEYEGPQPVQEFGHITQELAHVQQTPSQELHYVQPEISVSPLEILHQEQSVRPHDGISHHTSAISHQQVNSFPTYFAPDPDPNHPSAKIPITTDPHSQPSIGKSPHEIVANFQGYSVDPGLNPFLGYQTGVLGSGQVFIDSYGVPVSGGGPVSVVPQHGYAFNRGDVLQHSPTSVDEVSSRHIPSGPQTSVEVQGSHLVSHTQEIIHPPSVSQVDGDYDFGSKQSGSSQVLKTIRDEFGPTFSSTVASTFGDFAYSTTPSPVDNSLSLNPNEDPRVAVSNDGGSGYVDQPPKYVTYQLFGGSANQEGQEANIVPVVRQPDNELGYNGRAPESNYDYHDIRPQSYPSDLYYPGLESPSGKEASKGPTRGDIPVDEDYAEEGEKIVTVLPEGYKKKPNENGFRIYETTYSTPKSHVTVSLKDANPEYDSGYEEYDTGSSAESSDEYSQSDREYGDSSSESEESEESQEQAGSTVTEREVPSTTPVSIRSTQFAYTYPNPYRQETKRPQNTKSTSSEEDLVYSDESYRLPFGARTRPKKKQ